MNTPVVITMPLWLVWLALALLALIGIWMKCVQVQLRALYELYHLYVYGDAPKEGGA